MTDWTKAGGDARLAADGLSVGCGGGGDRHRFRHGRPDGRHDDWRTMQAAMRSQGALHWATQPDLSWIVPTVLAEDLAPGRGPRPRQRLWRRRRPSRPMWSTLKPSAKAAKRCVRRRARQRQRPAAAKPANSGQGRISQGPGRRRTRGLAGRGCGRGGREAQVGRRGCGCGVAGESVAVVETPAKAAPAPGLWSRKTSAARQKSRSRIARMI
jgi:hypothetical protein